jgi:hypothetical protein
VLSVGEINGHRSLWLENDVLRVTVLPGKGADVYELVHKPSGVDFLMKTPDGLRPPGVAQPNDFLDNYEGGWQELFPNAGDPCEHRGLPLRFHGEVALLGWSYVVERDDEETSVLLAVRCQKTRILLERRMRLCRGEPTLEIEEWVTNESQTPTEFVWGHHVVLGGGFLEDGCRLDVPARTLITPDELFEPETASLAPGQTERWPWAQGRSGEWVDLRYIPGPEACTHDDAYLTDLEGGHLSVENPSKGLRFGLEWDAALFRYVVLWTPYGGADLPPLTGIYGVGIEPWVSRFNLEEASRHGESVELGPGQSLTTVLRAAVTDV